MKTQSTLITARPPATAAIILRIPNPRPPPIAERASEAAGPARFDPQANLDDSAQFRADLLRRYKAPYTLAWRHGGLNE
jgi:hypothetical protein